MDRVWRERKKPRAIYTQWVRSVLIVVGILMGIFLLLCGFLLRQMGTVTLRMSSDISGYLRQSVDNRIVEIQKNLVLFEMNTANAALRKLETPPEDATIEIYRFCNQLENYCKTSGYVKNALIYYPKINRVAGSLGFYSIRQYNALMNIREQGPGDKWDLAWLAASGSSRFLYSGGHFLYLRNTVYNGATAGIMLVELDLDEFVRSSHEGDGASAFAILLDQQLVAISGDEETTLLLQQLLQQGPVTGGRVSGEGVIAYVSQSGYSELQYVAGFGYRSLYRPIYIAAAVSGAGLLVCLVVGAALSIRIGRRHAKPLHNLMEKFPGTEAGEDEYLYISNRVDQLLADKNTNDEKLHDQQVVIDNLFLNIVLRSEMRSDYQVFSAATHYNVLFEAPIYQAAVIRLPVAATEADSTTVLNHYRDHPDGGLSMMTACFEGDVVVLYNHEEPLESSEMKAKLQNLVDTLWPDGGARCGIGRPYDELADIYTSYTEAVAALPALRVKNAPRVASYPADRQKKPAKGQGEPVRNNSVSHRARDIILENLTDPMLGLYLISEQLGVSNTYLSSSFKNTFGVGVVQYINEQRILRAKGLILSTDMSIKDIALAVGYTSDISFIRVFKKYEQQTPSSLRKKEG